MYVFNHLKINWQEFCLYDNEDLIISPVNIKFNIMDTLNEKFTSRPEVFNSFLNSESYSLKHKGLLNKTTVTKLPQKIENFLQNNYANYSVEQIFIHKEGSEILRYEIGVDSVYEYTLYFDADGEFSYVDLIDN